MSLWLPKPLAKLQRKVLFTNIAPTKGIGKIFPVGYIICNVVEEENCFIPINIYSESSDCYELYRVYFTLQMILLSQIKKSKAPN